MEIPPSFPALPRRPAGAAGIAHYQSGHGGTPLLFIHGVGLSADCWHPQLTHFGQQQQVFAIDLPGHGESPPFSDKSPTMDDFSHKIADFIEKEVGTAVAVVGHSLGALIALRLAATQPRWISRVAALSPVHRRSPAAQQAVEARAAQLQDEQEGQDDNLHKATLARWFGAPPHPDWQSAAAACRHWLQQTDHTAYAAAYRLFARHGAEDAPLQNITQPLLALTGDGDGNSTPDMSRQIAAQVPAPATAEIIKGHAHMLQLTATAQVNAALTRWLSAASNGEHAA